MNLIISLRRINYYKLCVVAYVYYIFYTYSLLKICLLGMLNIQKKSNHTSLV